MSPAEPVRIATLCMPDPIASLPRNAVGYPVPWFVATIDGVPDFRVIAEGKMRDALRFKLCFLCGQRMGVYGTFLIGPMCAINKISAEPPSHKDCAIYAAQACPFLATPTMQRRPNRLPEDRTEPSGVMVLRNPGVSLAWTSRDWKTQKVSNGILFDVGTAAGVRWFAEGRDATRAEVLISIDSGLPALRDAAALDGPQGLAEFQRCLQAAQHLIPPD